MPRPPSRGKCRKVSFPRTEQNGESGLNFMKHFVSYVKPTPDDKILLLLDNHQSHINLEVIDYAKKNGVVMLSFPPHCSHKLQPLDRTVYGPFKRYYNNACNSWMQKNPGKTMSIYEIADMVGRAFPKAMTPTNIQSGFRVSPIFPFDRDIFSDEEFMPSNVTDRPMEITETLSTPSSSNQPPVITVDEMPPTFQNTFGDNATPESVRPFKKASPRKRKGRIQRGKTRILTDTPEKLAIEIQQSKKQKHGEKKQKVKKRLLHSTESNLEPGEMPAALDEEDVMVEEDCSTKATNDQSFEVIQLSDIQEGDFALVRFDGQKKAQHYIGHVIEVFEDGDITFRFLKRCRHSTLTDECATFVFPENSEEAKFTHSIKDVVIKLPNLVNRRGTKRCQQKYVFDVNLTSYNPP